MAKTSDVSEGVITSHSGWKKHCPAPPSVRRLGKRVKSSTKKKQPSRAAQSSAQDAVDAALPSNALGSSPTHPAFGRRML